MAWGRPLARVLGARIDDVADLLGEIDEGVLLEGGEGNLVGSEVQAREEAEVDGLEIQVDLGACEGGDDAAGVRGGLRGDHCRTMREDRLALSRA